MNCRKLKTSIIKRYVKLLKAKYGVVPFSKKDEVEECKVIIKGKSYTVLQANKIPYFFVFHSPALAEGKIDRVGKIENFVPTLNLMDRDRRFARLPKIIIDLGAVPYITKGSDLMRPGITDYDSIEKGSFVAIADEKYGKLLAVGIALISSKEFGYIKTGRVVKTIHHIGDALWKRSF